MLDSIDCLFVWHQVRQKWYVQIVWRPCIPPECPILAFLAFGVYFIGFNHKRPEQATEEQLGGG